mmetsp:Transcript_20556/g.59633  ORF Transcript_20556/g.59633 Transcript_20556/m.59633 type:complete len:141 (+) Transcript_20556:1672-2094(+)
MVHRVWDATKFNSFVIPLRANSSSFLAVFVSGARDFMRTHSNVLTASNSVCVPLPLAEEILVSWLRSSHTWCHGRIWFMVAQMRVQLCRNCKERTCSLEVAICVIVRSDAGVRDDEAWSYFLQWSEPTHVSLFTSTGIHY